MSKRAKLIPIYDATVPVACTITNAEYPSIEVVEPHQGRDDLGRAHDRRTGASVPRSPRGQRGPQDLCRRRRRCCEFWGFEILMDLMRRASVGRTTRGLGTVERTPHVLRIWWTDLTVKTPVSRARWESPHRSHSSSSLQSLRLAARGLCGRARGAGVAFIGVGIARSPPTDSSPPYIMTNSDASSLRTAGIFVAGSLGVGMALDIIIGDRYPHRRGGSA